VKYRQYPAVNTLQNRVERDEIMTSVYGRLELENYPLKNMRKKNRYTTGFAENYDRRKSDKDYYC
jgi:hypothetical protein